MVPVLPRTLDEANAMLAWERRARHVLQHFADVETETPTGALQAAIDAVCGGTGWPVGHALVRDPSNVLVSSRVWHLASHDEFDEFRRVTEASSFGPGVGLPGRVLSEKCPAWIMDVQADGNFPRAERSRPLRAAFAFPVIVGDRVAAVLEFFSTESIEPDPALLDCMSSVGAQLAERMNRLATAANLRRSELRFRSVTETATDAVIVANGSGTIVSWNQAAARMFGYRGDQIVGRPLVQIIPERLRAAHDAGFQRVRSGGPPAVIGRTVTLTGLRSDGSEFPLELSLSSWVAEGERFYSGILRDVTERHEAEERLRAIATRLETSERAAITASKAKTAFLANMSHELRTPLNAILGFVHLMSRDGSLSEHHRAYLDIVTRSGEHLLDLINSILSIARIESGDTETRPSPFEPRRLLLSLEDLLRLRAAARGLTLSFEVAAAWPGCVTGDERLLRQTLINLIGNAIKFTKAGDVVVRALHSEGRGRFEVEDTGPGIAAEDQARIFEPFVQTDLGANAVDGAGLGLTISRDNVARMGGRLEVRSEPHKGSCFFFEIPLPPAKAPGSTGEPRRVVGLAPGEPVRRALVIDDDPDSRSLLALVLGNAGFDVAEAGNGAEGVTEWSRFAPHIVWLDMRMPTMDGYATTRTIRERDATSGRPRTVVVAVTASAFDHDRPRMIAAGCDDIVAKPFREEMIFEVAARRLGARFLYEGDPGAPAPSSRRLPPFSRPW